MSWRMREGHPGSFRNILNPQPTLRSGKRLVDILALRSLLLPGCGGACALLLDEQTWVAQMVTMLPKVILYRASRYQTLTWKQSRYKLAFGWEVFKYPSRVEKLSGYQDFISLVPEDEFDACFGSGERGRFGDMVLQIQDESAEASLHWSWFQL
ncbi:uncharacterized protein PV06_05630 [Exophiala oligosperma]|uniref:Uncharacterized protein n=1 Tax=Exophiala oligosperma TaxID=215243 RepID=A0A0D2DGD2_9EURO|nr:uncharacterized protein PV06_05630 [Exophiala oligosperma]KIW42043.1 hypothetical protein PV06_05630 [Exophiala oligosperma]